MDIEVLLSCMHQADNSIVKKTNINSDALVINQCNRESYDKYSDQRGNFIRIVSTTERGLSRSRNMAINLAQADICLICDDDEILDDQYVYKILKAFENNPKADVICFALKGLNKKYPKEIVKINFLSALKISSVQIAFRRDKIIKNKIRFDETVGSGVSNAGGEENIFLYNCLRKKT